MCSYALELMIVGDCMWVGQGHTVFLCNHWCILCCKIVNHVPCVTQNNIMGHNVIIHILWSGSEYELDFTDYKT